MTLNLIKVMVTQQSRESNRSGGLHTSYSNLTTQVITQSFSESNDLSDYTHVNFEPNLFCDFINAHRI